MEERHLLRGTEEGYESTKIHGVGYQKGKGNREKTSDLTEGRKGIGNPTWKVEEAPKRVIKGVTSDD